MANYGGSRSLRGGWLGAQSVSSFRDPPRPSTSFERAEVSGSNVALDLAPLRVAPKGWRRSRFSIALALCGGKLCANLHQWDAAVLRRTQGLTPFRPAGTSAQCFEKRCAREQCQSETPQCSTQGILPIGTSPTTMPHLLPPVAPVLDGDNCCSHSWPSALTRIQVILNRKSGRGSVRDVWDDDIRPVFQYAAHIYDDGPLKVLMTEEPEDAKRQVQELDLSSIDGLCVVGGDGLMQEVRTRCFENTRCRRELLCSAVRRSRVQGDWGH